MVTATKIGLKKYSQGQTAENILDVLTGIRKGSCGFGKTAESSSQHLELRQRNMPLAGVFLNQLSRKQQSEHIKTHIYHMG